MSLVSFDGEGSFTVYIRDPRSFSNRRRRVKAEPRFFLKLQDTDKQILSDLKKFFGCGNVYFQKDTRPQHRHCYRFEVTKRDDLNDIIIPFFRRNRLKFASKKKDFEIFCAIMEEIKKGSHLTDSGLIKIYEMKQKMH